jgi:hypothetical protein
MNFVVNIITTMNKHINNLLNNTNTEDTNDNNETNNKIEKKEIKKNIKRLKIFFPDYNGSHHKNRQYIEYFISKYPHIVNNIEKANVIISVHTFFDPSKYSDKLFIFGPQFCIFPNDDNVNFNNIYSNAYYNNLSEWCKNVWLFYNYDKVPLLTMPYGVDTDLFKPNKDRKERTEVILYYKNRHPIEILYLINFIISRNIKVNFFDYSSGYEQDEYIECLKNAKYCIWVGSHESQGFALQECLSCDVPILVWDVIRMLQEYGNEEKYQNINVIATTIPYWSDKCGEYFVSPYDIDKIYDKFINNLDNYKPREYILETLSREKCYKNWIDTIKDLYQKIEQ